MISYGKVMSLSFSSPCPSDHLLSNRAHTAPNQNQAVVCLFRVEGHSVVGAKKSMTAMSPFDAGRSTAAMRALRVRTLELLVDVFVGDGHFGLLGFKSCTGEGHFG
jgi:hypothetical protein